MKSLQFKNYHITFINVCLNYISGNFAQPGTPLQLHGQESRSRAKFLRLIESHIKNTDEGQQEIVARHAKKDKDKKPIKTETGFSINNMDKFNKEYEVFMNEKAVIDVLPSNKEILRTIKEMFLNLKREFSVDEGKIYDEVCEIFEQL